ncbi:DUF305 domain-containing protein [Sphaerimonospora sp. CA-214678]|uniref:DUF305 domain-containing protein n=1 Tax=Sphaerimonospora sp. CA-214678 TaxID=3240029 RepID=UPI003D8C55F7
MISIRRVVPPRLTGVLTSALAMAVIAGCGGSAGGDAGSTVSPAAATPSAQPSMTPAESLAESPSAAPAGDPSEAAASPAPVVTPAVGYNAADVRFAQMVIPHHLQAMDMTILARTQAGDQWVRDLAMKITETRDPQIRTAKGWLDEWGEEPLPRDHRMPGMASKADITRLSKASGLEFDRLFIELMIEHHRGSIEVAQQEQAEGAFAEAKSMADALVTGQRAEIKEMRGYLKKLESLKPRS